MQKATVGIVIHEEVLVCVCVCACTSTCSQACERQSELAHKVVFCFVIVVLHYKAHQGQIRNLHLEAQRAVPARVEACRGRTRAVNVGRRNPFEMN